MFTKRNPSIEMITIEPVDNDSDNNSDNDSDIDNINESDKER